MAAKRKRRAAPLRRCKICRCTNRDCSGCVARTGKPCRWVEAELCSACDPEGPMLVVAERCRMRARHGLAVVETPMPILLYLLHFRCQWLDHGRMDRHPCAGDSPKLCVPYAASVILGRGAERFRASAAEYRRWVRMCRKTLRARRRP